MSSTSAALCCRRKMPSHLAVHNRFCKGGAALPISRVGSVDTLVRPSTNLLPGTEAFLKSAVPDTAFYWIPATINLPGIDGVLGDNAGNVYAIQGTIASAYRSPVEGLKSLWDKVGPRLRAGGCHPSFHRSWRTRGICLSSVKRGEWRYAAVSFPTKVRQFPMHGSI